MLRVPRHTLMSQHLVLCVTFFVSVSVRKFSSYFIKLSLVLVSKPVRWIQIISFMTEYSINVCLLKMKNINPWVNTLKYAVHEYGFNYWEGWFFFFPSVQTPVQWLPGAIYPWVQSSWYTAYHSTPSSAEGYNRMELHLYSSRCHSWLCMYHQLYLLYF